MTTITTKTAKNGSTRYYVNGKLTRKADIEFKFANNPACEDIIKIDYETAKYQFPNLRNGLGANMVVFTINDTVLMTEAAAKILGFNVRTPFAKGIYHVSPAATNNNNEEEKTMTANNTKAAKIAAIENAIQAVIAERNEAYDELAAAEDNDEIAQWFIDQLKENLEDLGNQYWELVAELDAAKAEPDDDDDPEPPTNDTPETDASEDDDTPSSEEQAAHIASQFQKMRQFAYKLISVEYLTNSQVNSILVAIFADNANEEQVKRLVEKFKADNDRYIDACSKTIKKILDDEAKRAELGNKNVFDLLPELDELNDVDDDEPTSAPLTEELRFTPYGNVRQRLFIGDEKIRFFDDEFIDLWNGKYRVGVHQLGITTVHVAVDDEDGGHHWEKFDMDNLSEEFWSLMADRGACSFDEPVDEPPTDDAPDTIAAVAETIQDLNDHAPDGWEVFYNADNKNFTVAFDEKPVANIDSLALLKVLPPDEFFSKFQSSADEQFTADRVDEIAALKEMRSQLAGDTERLKIIDDLINDATRAAILG